MVPHSPMLPCPVQQLLCRDKGKAAAQEGFILPKTAAWRSPSSCRNTEPSLPMSPLSPSCWPGQAGGGGFGARGCCEDIWSASLLLLSVWEHYKLEIPKGMHQLCTPTCINKSSALLSPGTGPYHSAQCFQQHPAHHHSCTGELPSLQITLTCTPHAVSTHLGGAGQCTKTCTELDH